MAATRNDYIVLLAFLGLVIGAAGGGIAYGVSESRKPATITTHCITGQTRVVESNKTREFHVLWDESCPK